MLQSAFLCIDGLRWGCRSFAGDETGSLTVGMGVYAVVFLLLVAGLFGLGSHFSQDLAADLETVKIMLSELT